MSARLGRPRSSSSLSLHCRSSSVLEYVVLVDREQVDVVLVLDRLGVGVQGRVEELLHFLLASASFN